MKKEQEEKQKEKEMLDDLRTEMYYQEWEAKERERDAAEQAKRVRERQVLRQAEKEDHENLPEDFPFLKKSTNLFTPE